MDFVQITGDSYFLLSDTHVTHETFHYQALLKNIGE